MKITSKDLRKKYHFVLYDNFDNIVCLIDSFDELTNFIGMKLFHLVQKYKKKDSNIVDIVIDGKIYQLYAFED